MGIVYQAQHPNLDRYAAVKFLAANLAMDKTYIDMFLREAKAAAKLNHPNIIAIYDAGSVGEDVYYLIMEYVDGRDLRSLLREQLVLPVAEAVHYIRQVCSGLGYAHRKKVIHRDIKPENLMLTDEGIIKIGDLGLAKWIGEDAGSLTSTGLVMGSPFYIAPERLRGDPDVNESTDVYSLGGTFFHLITGKVPYEGTAPVVMAKHLDSPVPNPLDVNPSLDPKLCQIIMKMMAKDQRERYKTTQEVDADLADYEHSLSHPVLRAIPTKEQSSTILPVPEELAKEGIIAVDRNAPPESEVFPKSAAAKSKPSIPIGAIVGAIAVVCAVLAFVFLPSKPREQKEPPTTAAAAKPAQQPVDTAIAPNPPAPTETSRPAITPEDIKPVEAVPPPAPAPGQVVVLDDFESGTEGWKIEQGFNMGGPTRSNDYAHSGKGSIVFRHYFKKDEETSAACVIFDKPKDLSGFKEIHVWVRVPDGDSRWTLQLFSRSGKDMAQNWGKPYKAWLGDWYMLKLDVRSIDFPKDVREIGVHVKNPGDLRAGLFFDQVEVVK